MEKNIIPKEVHKKSVNVHDLSYSTNVLEAILVTVVWAATGDHVDVCDVHCY